MKITLAAATVAALVGVAGAANAADLYKGGSLKDAPVEVAPPIWTGLYLGGHVGGFWTDNKFTDDGYYDASYNGNYWPKRTAYSWNDNESGVFGGGQVGYNFQSGAFVFGVEADFGVVGFNTTDTHYDYWHKNDTSFYADVTGRLGYASGPALFYAKGGWAYLDDSSSFGWGDYTNKNSSLDGWTIGGGIEYLWSPSWSVKAEYLHFDFGKKSIDNAYTTGNAWCYTNYNETYSREFAIDTFKVGINYHFANNYAAPLK
jgi:opacity protein-like surface antigen